MVFKPLVFKLWLVVATGLLPVAALAADLSILGTYSSGDFGNAVESKIQSTWLRFATGDRYQFRVAAPYLRIEATDVLVQPGVGTVPISRRSGQGDSMGNGSGSQNGQSEQGSGGGSSDDPIDDGTTTVTSSTASGLGDVWMSGFIRVLGGDAKVYRIAQSHDCDGSQGGLDQPGEPIIWNGKLILTCFDKVTGPDKVNTKHDKPYTMSMLQPIR